MQSRTRSPDVVLLDLGLPDMDGLEVTKRIRSWSRMPIIVLSARGRERDKVDALDAGADDYLTKPFGVRSSGPAQSCSASQATRNEGPGARLLLGRFPCRFGEAAVWWAEPRFT